jgi:hypothetical protein
MEPLSRKPKNRENKVLQTVRITREEYNDYQNMKNFIFENDLGVEDIVNQMKEETLRQNDENHRQQNNLLN